MVWPLSQGDVATALTGRRQISRARKNAVHFFAMESLFYVICAVKQAPSAKCAGVRKSIILYRIWCVLERLVWKMLENVGDVFYSLKCVRRAEDGYLIWAKRKP